MKRASILVFCGFFACLLASASVVQAGGFQLFEYGARAVGMGTANYAVGNDPSVIAYNPSLMTQFDTSQVMVGMAAIAPSSDVNITSKAGALGAVGDSKTKDQTFMVPHAYYVLPATDKVSLGVGMFTRYGLGTKYSDDWGGQHMLKEILLESVSFQPTAAFQFTDDLSIGIGVEVLKGSMYLKKAHPGGGDATVDVDGYAVGGNLSANYRFNDEWNMGFIYRSPVNFTGSGSVEALGVAAIAGGPQDGDATVSAVFPSSYTLGLGYKPLKNLTFEASTIFTRWELFDKMKFRYTGVNSAVIPDNDEYFYYKNTWRFQLGAEYQATDFMALRAGYTYDQTPTRHDYASVMLPANDRKLYSLGMGFEGDNWYCDFSGMYIVTKERKSMSKTVNAGAATTTFTYDFVNGKTYVGSMSFGYAF